MQHLTELLPVITGRGVPQTAQPLGIPRQKFPREPVLLKTIVCGLAQVEILKNTQHSSPTPLKHEACADFYLTARTAQPHGPFLAAPLTLRGSDIHQPEHIWARMSSCLCLSAAGHFVQLEGKENRCFPGTAEPQTTRRVQRWFSFR